MPHTRLPILSALVALLGLGLALSACSGRPVANVPVGPAEPEPVVLSVDRGHLLYDTHCVACHDRQVHWRDHSLVGSWSDLIVQVDRWQTNAGQHWGPSEIGDVAAYLNSLYYRMPCSAIGCSGDSTALLAAIAAPVLTPDAEIRSPLIGEVP